MRVTFGAPLLEDGKLWGQKTLGEPVTPDSAFIPAFGEKF